MRCSFDHQKNIACVQTQLTTEKERRSDEWREGKKKSDKNWESIKLSSIIINMIIAKCYFRIFPPHKKDKLYEERNKFWAVIVRAFWWLFTAK